MQTLRPPTLLTSGPHTAAVAWSLDAVAFHAELESLLSHLDGPLGTGPVRERAAALWQSDDPEIRGYVSLLPLDTPEDWAVGFEEHHLGQWYRLLMAGHLRPARALADATTVARRLPELGWSPADARRAARGRPLHTLARTHATPPTATAIGLVVNHGCKGWLAADDLREVLQRLQAIDRRSFRRAQDLVPLCEDLWDTCEAALGEGEDQVLLLPPHGC